MAQELKAFIGGGGDDWISGIVKDYVARYAQLNPGIDARYYSWTEQTIFGDLLRYTPATTKVTLVGHSYGGDAAFSIVTDNLSVDTLITIDPVGRLRPSWLAIRARARMWMNVRAEPDGAHRSFADTIAAIGGKYPRPPVPGQPGAPNYAFIANTDHGDFWGMMRHGVGGVSGAMLLGGTHVP